jgi:hypothetical protein
VKLIRAPHHTLYHEKRISLVKFFVFLLLLKNIVQGRKGYLKVEKRFQIENRYFYFSIPGKVLFNFSIPRQITFILQVQVSLNLALGPVRVGFGYPICPIGAWTWPNKPGPPERPLMGWLGQTPNSIQLDFAASFLCLVESIASSST